jgi:CRP-like cAMP-binding protein
MLTTQALKQVPIFSLLSSATIDEIITVLKPRDLAAGEILFNQGDPGDELILVESGKIAIYVPLPGLPGEGQPIRIFQPGELLGEMALIDRKPRSASARAEQASRIMSLGGAEFLNLLATNPDMTLSVMGGLSDRIRYTTDFLAEVRKWVRRIAEGQYETGNFDPGSQFQDKTLATLAAEFAQMAARVQQREEVLRQQVAQLRIEIDEVKRKQEAEQIMSTDYFQGLREKIKRLREEEE